MCVTNDVSTYIWFGHDAERAVGGQKWGEITFEETSLKSDNQQYNTLVGVADGTKKLLNKSLTFQLSFFHNFL